MFDIPYCGYNIRNDDYDIIDRPNGSSSYLFLYFKSEMDVLLGNRKVVAKPGTMLLYSPGYRQWYQAHRIFYNSFVHFTDPDNFMDKLNIPLNTLINIEQTEEINEIIRRIEQEFQHQDNLFHEHMSANLELLLITLSREYNRPPVPSKVNAYTLETFFKLRMHILSHLDYDWNTSNMAELAGMSKTQFYHYYNYIFKQSPKAELIHARLEYSKFLLTNRALPVNQIASMIGYSNESHFIRLFKKYYGISPKQFALKFQRESANKVSASAHPPK